MYLIDTNNLELVYFTVCPSGQYAILSHTWEDGEEVDIQAFRNGSGVNRKGFKKIEQCCRQAQDDGFKYAWVDTCCIDKGSSAELSEAINSMYAWYKQAAVCYVFLADFDTKSSNGLERLSRCRWFTRGWTLQELVAPSEVRFFDAQWEFIETRTRLATHIQRITGIDKNIFTGYRDIQSCSIAQRMSWAARRTTTRIEDMAYCLLGLFNVSMSLLYGEGGSAFLRLQEEIIAISDDESIFAWTRVGVDGSGLLAKSPTNFSNAGKIFSLDAQKHRSPYRTTNRGLEIECELLPVSMNLYETPLHCLQFTDSGQRYQLGIYISRTPDDNQYRRVIHNCTDLFAIVSYDTWRDSAGANMLQKKTLYLNDRVCIKVNPYGQMPLIRACNATYMRQSVEQLLPYPDSSIDLASQTSRQIIPLVLEHEKQCSVEKFESFPVKQMQSLHQGVLGRSLHKRMRFTIRAGFTSSFEPLCLLTTSDRTHSLHALQRVSLLSIADHDDLRSEKGLVRRRFRPYYSFKGRSRGGLHCQLIVSRAAIWNLYYDTAIEVNFEPSYKYRGRTGLLWNLTVTLLKCRRVSWAERGVSSLIRYLDKYLTRCFIIITRPKISFSIAFVLALGIAIYLISIEGQSFVREMFVAQILVMFTLRLYFRQFDERIRRMELQIWQKFTILLSQSWKFLTWQKSLVEKIGIKDHMKKD